MDDTSGYVGYTPRHLNINGILSVTAPRTSTHPAAPSHIDSPQRASGRRTRRASAPAGSRTRTVAAVGQAASPSGPASTNTRQVARKASSSVADAAAAAS